MTKWELDEATQRWLNGVKGEWLAKAAFKVLAFGAAGTVLFVFTVATLGRGSLAYFILGGSVACLTLTMVLAIRAAMYARDSS